MCSCQHSVDKPLAVYSRILNPAGRWAYRVFWHLPEVKVVSATFSIMGASVLLEIIQIVIVQFGVAGLLLFLGDLISTFLYHVPEHVFGKLHLKTHHAAQKTFSHYAVLFLDAQVLLDGLLGALSYLLMAVMLWQYSPIGVGVGLLLGQGHVWWRHTSALGWRTPGLIVGFCRVLGITTPEQHWVHHQKVTHGFGDIFTCFDYPARVWLRWLRWLRVHVRSRNTHFTIG